jgi:hypothetical protein
LPQIETFTGRILTADVVQHFIDHPANAMNIHGNERGSMDLQLAWGIEAREVDHKVSSRRKTLEPT